MKSRAIVIMFVAAVVAGALGVEAVHRVAGAQAAEGDPSAVVVVPAPAPAPAAAPPPTIVRGFDPDGWVKVIGALVVLAGAIGAIVSGWATVTGNRRAEARELAAAARAELQAAQLRAVATSTGATVIPTPPPAPPDPPRG